MLRTLLTLFIAIILVGCGSTAKTIKEPTQPVNNGIAKLVKYGILEAELADKMALKEQQRLVDANSEFRDSPVGALTGNGDLLTGFALSSIMGAGLSLGDFLSPENILLAGFTGSRTYQSYESGAVFIEIPASCNEECAINKFIEIGLKTKKIYFNAKDIEFDFGKDDVEVSTRRGRIGKEYGYYVTDENGNEIRLFLLGEPEIFMVGGKYYYGGNPTSGDLFNSDWRLGNISAEDIDIGINAILDVSSEYPELFTYIPKNSFIQSEDPTKGFSGCRGNLIIQDGKIEMLYQMFGCYAYADPEKARPESVIIY
jgi:hypothetical protein